MASLIRKRLFPIIGGGGGVFSHVHIDDAATATAIAVEHGEPGIYNIVDDDPAPVREWLPVLASARARPGQAASSRTTVSTRSTSARVVRKFVMQARSAKRPSTVAFDR
jgi:nucleoside-diphosphate-sugar epimerase